MGVITYPYPNFSESILVEGTSHHIGITTNEIQSETYIHPCVATLYKPSAELKFLEQLNHKNPNEDIHG